MKKTGLTDTSKTEQICIASHAVACLFLDLYRANGFWITSHQSWSMIKWNACGAVLISDLALDKFFAAERMLHFRPSWQAYTFDSVQVLMRGEIDNPALESEADRFLAEHGFDADGTEK